MMHSLGSAASGAAHDAENRLPTLMPRPATSPFDLTRYEIPHAAPFLCNVRVTREHLGTVIPHVSNIEYVRWLDRAAELHADSLGYTRAFMLEHGIMWFVARHEIDYFAECWLDDDLVIATWVRDFHKVRSWRDYLIVRPRDSTVICRAATLWVLVDLATRRPRRIEREMIERFQALT
jgi:acyl-CoA thioester hydrolase